MNKKLIRNTIILIILILLLNINYIFAQDDNYRQGAIAILQEHDNPGYLVYLESDKDKFDYWLDVFSWSNDYGYLYAVVHECVHSLNGHKNDSKGYRYFLLDGSYTFVNWYDLFPRSEIAIYLEDPQKDFFYETYIIGEGGYQDITSILDEIAAYIFSTNTQINLKDTVYQSGCSNKEGLLSFMLYLELYLHHARTKKKAAYNKIKNNENYLKTIKILWENAEDLLLKYREHFTIGRKNINRLNNIYNEKNLLELKLLYEDSDIKINFREEELKEL